MGKPARYIMVHDGWIVRQPNKRDIKVLITKRGHQIMVLSRPFDEPSNDELSDSPYDDEVPNDQSNNDSQSNDECSSHYEDDYSDDDDDMGSHSMSCSESTQ